MGIGKSNHFIERSICGVLSFFSESVFADEYAGKDGFLQKRDARIKTISFLMLLLAVLFAKNAYPIAAIYLSILVLAALSKINLWFFLKRTWIFIPLFCLFTAIPALFDFFSPGEPIASVRIFHLNLVITRQGLSAAGLFIMRVLTSVSIAVLLGLTTRSNVLLKILRIFHIPQIFVMILGMCYRYIYLFVEVVEHTYLAIKSRIGKKIHHKKGREIVTRSMAGLWQRSYHLNGQVYQAMLARGFKGEPKVHEEFKANLTDWMVFTGTLMFFVLILLHEIQGRG